MSQPVTVQEYCKDHELEEEYESLQALRYHKWTSLANIDESELQAEITQRNEENGSDLCPINKGAARELIKKAKEVTGKTGTTVGALEGPDRANGKRASLGSSTSDVTKKAKLTSKELYEQFPNKYGGAAMLEKVFVSYSTRHFAGYGTFNNAAQVNSQTIGACYFAHPESGEKFLEMEDPNESNKWKGAYKCTYPGCKRIVSDFSPLASLGCIQNLRLVEHDENDQIRQGRSGERNCAYCRNGRVLGRSDAHEFPGICIKQADANREHLLPDSKNNPTFFFCRRFPIEPNYGTMHYFRRPWHLEGQVK